jgi:electron transfer flavoprotein alpha subunit
MDTPADRPSGGILVFCEQAETLGELLTPARGFASRLQRPLVAVAAGSHAGLQVEEALARGADEVLRMRGLEGDDLVAEESLAVALCEAIRAEMPAIVLVGATRTGAGVAAAAAQQLQVPCANSCVEMSIDDAGNLTVERRVYGGRFVSRQRLDAAPRLATVPPKRHPRAPTGPASEGRVREVRIASAAPRIRAVGVSPRSASAVDISKAQVIVGAGRGVKQQADLALLERLAALLGGVLAGSRPLTGDVDWLPVDRRVGLSGQTVKPNLYIACGISGQIEHIVGMKGARTVVAINNDPKAPIHAEADYSVVGDLYEIVPALLEACGKARRAPAS